MRSLLGLQFFKPRRPLEIIIEPLLIAQNTISHRQHGLGFRDGLSGLKGRALFAKGQYGQGASGSRGLICASDALFLLVSKACTVPARFERLAIGRVG